MEAYLDNSATTRCSESVREHHVTGHDERLRKSVLLTSDGKKAEDYIKEAREKIAKTLKVTEKRSFLLPEVRNRII